MSLESACKASDLFRDDEERDTFVRRLKRALKKPVQQSSPQEFFEDAVHMWFGDEDFPFTVEKLAPLADLGSPTAADMLQSAILFVLGREALSNGSLERATTAFAEVYRKNSLVVVWRPEEIFDILNKMESLFLSPLCSQKTRAEAIFVHANLNFAMGQIGKGLDEVEMACTLLPDDGYFYATKGCVLSMQMQLSAAVKAFEKAASLGCDDITHTLFHLAILMSRKDRMEQLLEEYVERAEPDARKLPEACYRLALLHGLKGPRHVGKAKRFFSKGKEADQHRLPIFHDEAAQHREQVHTLLKRYEACGNPVCNESGNKYCSACQMVAYCSHSCQKQHWKEHKKMCRKSRC